MKDKLVDFTLQRVRANDTHAEFYMGNPEMKAFAFTFYDTFSLLGLLVKSFGSLSKVVADRFALMSFNLIADDDYVAFLDRVVRVVDVENSLLWRMVIDSLLYVYKSSASCTRSASGTCRRCASSSASSRARGATCSSPCGGASVLRPMLLSALMRFFDDADVIEQGYEILEAVLHAQGGVFHLDADAYTDCFDDIDQSLL